MTGPLPPPGLPMRTCDPDPTSGHIAPFGEHGRPPSHPTPGLDGTGPAQPRRATWPNCWSLLVGPLGGMALHHSFAWWCSWFDLPGFTLCAPRLHPEIHRTYVPHPPQLGPFPVSFSPLVLEIVPFCSLRNGCDEQLEPAPCLRLDPLPWYQRTIITAWLYPTTILIAYAV